MIVPISLIPNPTHFHIPLPFILLTIYPFGPKPINIIPITLLSQLIPNTHDSNPKPIIPVS